ncbi:MAG: flagellar basal-body rod protein FlgG [Leptospiraceae bacterium]|nr:flagellar basal-body rod protein FlgG [Leptospiraceae bacterium]MCB1322744.1 flagellar basal-body rod protein FlgG [Leptospiraceae bacterium]
MMRSLWTAATGMIGQQYNIDTISNNLANVNTFGFKKNRVDFEDLIYQQQVLAGTPATAVSEIPTGVNVGHGVRVAATQKLFEMGSLQATGNVFDLAITSDVGFFKILTPDGSFAYTRDGSFKIDSRRQIVTSNGHLLEPAITLPDGAINSTFQVSENGEVTVKVGDEIRPRVIGQVDLYRFVNPAGLQAIGKNLFKETVASGPEIQGTPGIDGMSSLLQGFVETSNVKLVEEMVNMIVAQRAYESNSKAVTTSDSMLGTAIGMKR